MITWSDIITFRMKRQFLSSFVDRDHYDDLFLNMSPVPTTYWCEPGNPPSLPLHVDFDDYDYNSIRRSRRDILKGRYGGGSIAYVTREDLELFGCLYKKELTEISSIQTELLELLSEEGPMNIGLMKELTGLFVKDITPALHKLQEAFLVYEDQLDNEGDRGWYLFESEFPEIDLKRYNKTEALKLAIPRFAKLIIFFDDTMLKSYYKLPIKLIKEAISELLTENVLKVIILEGKRGYLLQDEEQLLQDEIQLLQDEEQSLQDEEQLQQSNYKSLVDKDIKTTIPPVLLLQRNDFLVRAYADELKSAYHSEWDALYYLLIDGEFHGVVVGRFKFGPHVIEDIILDLAEEEKENRREEIQQAVYCVFDRTDSPIKNYNGQKNN